MEKETLRMQMLAGVITESEYKAKLNENLKFNQVEKNRKYFATTDFGIFKKGDEVFIDTVRNLGAEVVIELSNSKGKHDSIKGDLEEEVEVFDNTVKESLNEHYVAGGIVGVGAINNPFEGRKKEVYEDAFEYFLSERYETKFENREQDLNEEEEEEDLDEGEEPSLYEGEGNGVEEFLDSMINMSIPEDAEEGEKVSGVWEANEYANEDSYGEAANEFKSAHQYILDNGGTITIEGNPDVTYTALDNGDIKYDLIVTLDEGKEVEEPNNY